MGKVFLISLIKQILVVLLLFNSCPAQDKIESDKDHDFNLLGTEWYNDPYINPNGEQIFDNGDSLYFYSDDKVRYFIGSELSFTFTSEYSVNKDTLILKTKLQAFEVADVSHLDPNLIQKYLISPDTLHLVYSAFKRNDKFIESDSSSYTKANSFIRIK